MNTTMIPKAVLDILAKGPWKADSYSLTKFEWLLGVHKESDERDGRTCQMLGGGEGITKAEAKQLINSGALHEDFYNVTENDTIYINQHYHFSLEQFFAVCTKEWEAHVERTNALIGTPAGTILK
jgi:hypothetical protein